MNAQTFPAPPRLRAGPSKSPRVASGSDRGTSGIPPIEHRTTKGPVGVYTGPDPLAVWPPRPGISRDRRKRPQSHGPLIALVLGIGVFFFGAVRIAAHLGYTANPVIVHLLYSM